MSRVPKQPSIPKVPDSVKDPDLRRFLQRIKDALETFDNSEPSLHRPTVQDLIDASVPNAEDIE